MKKLILVLALVFIGSISIAQMGPMHNVMEHRMVRHHYAMMNGIPEEYRNLSNPIEANKENIKAGEKLYNSHCVSCHGTKGYGDGPAGQALNPPPANIAFAVCMPMTTDSYLFWSISDGGRNLGNAMPSFKETLPKDNIWKVILYVRAGLSNC
jgi:mono/diheme cytochrome c family protein